MLRGSLLQILSDYKDGHMNCNLVINYMHIVGKRLGCFIGKDVVFYSKQPDMTITEE